MTMLSAGDVASMRATCQEAMPDTAIIYRRSWASDGGGGGSATFTAAGTVACRLAPTTSPGDEEPIADRLAEASHWTIAVPALTDVRQDDRITVSTVTYEVMAVNSPRSWELERLVFGSEVS